MPRAGTVCRLDLAHPRPRHLSASVARGSAVSGRSAVVHRCSRSDVVAAPSGVCDRSRLRSGRAAQSSAASTAFTAVRDAGSGGGVSHRRPAGRRRAVVSRPAARPAVAHQFATAQPQGGRLTNALLRMVHSYQLMMEGRPSPCRFTPSCSCYASESLQQYGLGRGLLLTLRRFLRCRPFGPSGWDPVPDTFLRKRAAA